MKLTRRGLLGGLAIAGASAAGGAGTLAYLQDSEGTGMTINVGTLSLSNTGSFEFEEDPESEGEDSFETTITIENDGTLPIRQIVLREIEVSDSVLAASLELTDILYGQSTDPDSNTSILSDLESNENGNGIFDLDDLRQNLESSDVRLEELIDDSEDGDGEVLHVGDEVYLTIRAKWDYSQIPGSGSTADGNSTETETPDYNGATLTGTITIDGRQEEA